MRKTEICIENLANFLCFQKNKIPQIGFYSTFEEQLSHSHPLYILANQINWKIFEEAFSKLYSQEGRPAKPIRLMVSLIILKHIRNISDEVVNNGLKIFTINILAEKNICLRRTL